MSPVNTRYRSLYLTVRPMRDGWEGEACDQRNRCVASLCGQPSSDVALHNLRLAVDECYAHEAAMISK